MTEHLKLIRIKLEYKDDTSRLAELFELMTKETPVLFECFSRLREHCVKAYGI